MAHVSKFHGNDQDALAALARPDVAVDLGLPAEHARLLYPYALAVTVINCLKAAETPVALVELEGFHVFRDRVRDQFPYSNLEDWEIREAFDIIRRHARNPRAPMQFKFSTRQQERSVAEIFDRLQGN